MGFLKRLKNYFDLNHRKQEVPIHQCKITGVDVYASADGGGHGVTPGSPCSAVVAFGITQFLHKLYPESRNRILFMGDNPIAEIGGEISDLCFTGLENGMTAIEPMGGERDGATSEKGSG